MVRTVKISSSASPKLRLKVESFRAYILGIILLAVFPIFVRDPYILNVLIIALIFSILAASWNFISGYTGILTFGHQAFFGIGAYFSALLAMKAGISPWAGLFIGGVVAALLGFFVGLPCLRLRAAPYIATATLALAEIARLTCMNLVRLTRGELGLWGIPNFPNITLPILGEVTFSGGVRIPYYYLVLIIFFVMMTLFYFIFRSPIGLAFGAIRDSQDAAQSLGIHVTYYKLLAFVTSAFFAGVAGSFYAHYLLILTPTSVFSIGLMIEIIAMTMVGGVGTFMGPLVGSFLLTVGLEYLRFMGEYRFMTFGILLVVIILFLPQGLGKKLFHEKKAFGIS
jgi:branched-chain amino acid transport system permease protein